MLLKACLQQILVWFGAAHVKAVSSWLRSEGLCGSCHILRDSAYNSVVIAVNMDGCCEHGNCTVTTVVFPRYSPLAEQFSRQFPSHDLPSVLAKFSLPVSLSEFRSPLAPPAQEVSH